MNRDDLYRKSVDIITLNQHSSGGYVACPTFPIYNYSWFRDSAYIAYAMDLAGEYDSAERFHFWAVENINKREPQIRRLMNGSLDNYEEILHTRYTLNGDTGTEEWENFQLDGFGVWIWSLHEHVRLSGRDLTESMEKAVELVSGYLCVLWEKPCYDCWEENRNEKHTYTMSSIYRGLQSSDKLLSRDSCFDTSMQIKNWILNEGVCNGSLCKYQSNAAVDSSLLGVYFPNNVLNNSDPVMRRTVERIQRELYKKGGVHRYTGDTYYGGGIWILLTAWLGIWLVDDGKRLEAEKILDWISSKADRDGQLAEQYTESLNDPSFLSYWNDKWGASAKPLLWSHAMYIILYKKLYS